METLAFILSLIGTACICIPPLLKGKNMKTILLLVFSANIFVAVSYVLTGAFTGAASCFVGGAQTIINYFFDRKNKKLPVWMVVIYALSFIAVNMLVFNHIWDLIAMVASLSFILCISQKNGTRYRMASGVNTLLWIIYDLVSMSYGPLLTHTIQISTVISGVVIHDLKKKKPKIQYSHS